MHPDPLLVPKQSETTACMVVDHASKITKIPCEIRCVHSPQIRQFFASRGMADFLLPNTEVDDEERLAAVRRYYDHIDLGAYESVRALFAEDAQMSSFPFRRHATGLQIRDREGCHETWEHSVPIDHIRGETRYQRCDMLMPSKDVIDTFFTPEGRKLRGTHILEVTIAVRGLVFAIGKFSGTSVENVPLQKEFADVWHFLADDLHVRERRTYLRNSAETLCRENRRPVTPEDLLRQITLSIQSDLGIVAEVIGFPHDPDLANVCYKQRKGDAKLYFNTDGEHIR